MDNLDDYRTGVDRMVAESVNNPGMMKVSADYRIVTTASCMQHFNHEELRLLLAVAIEEIAERERNA